MVSSFPPIEASFGEYYPEKLKVSVRRTRDWHPYATEPTALSGWRLPPPGGGGHPVTQAGGAFGHTNEKGESALRPLPLRFFPAPRSREAGMFSSWLTRYPMTRRSFLVRRIITVPTSRIPIKSRIRTFCIGVV